MSRFGWVRLDKAPARGRPAFDVAEAVKRRLRRGDRSNLAPIDLTDDQQSAR